MNGYSMTRRRTINNLKAYIIEWAEEEQIRQKWTDAEKAAEIARLLALEGIKEFIEDDKCQRMNLSKH